MSEFPPIIECDGRRHGPAILAILNHAIVHTTALYDYHPRTPGQMAQWFQTKQAAGYPVLGIESPLGELMGFASYGSFRAFPAYKYTAEHSIYVEERFRGRGLARTLLKALQERARSEGFHTLVGVIDASNDASLALHRQAGFQEAGTLRQVGFKFGRWLDVTLMQWTSDAPEHPVDG